MHTLLGLTPKDAQLLADGAARRGLIRRLMGSAFGASKAWVNITLLQYDGTDITAHDLCSYVLSDGEKGVKATKSGSNDAVHQTLRSIDLLRREHVGSNGRFCGLPPMGTMLAEGAYCLPHDACVLLVACAGFPDRETNHGLSVIVAHELALDLSLLTKQSAASA